jgi:hypothetical protein
MYLIWVATVSGASVSRNTAKRSAMLLLTAGTKTHRFEVICDEATIMQISMKSMKRSKIQIVET